jgi:hypothetical protein
VAKDAHVNDVEIDKLNGNTISEAITSTCKLVKKSLKANVIG